MRQAKIIDITPRIKAACKHRWIQTPETGTGWQFICERCGTYGYRGSYARDQIKPYKHQDKAKDYIDKVRHLECWKNPEPENEPTWEDLQYTDCWIDPPEEWDL